MFKIITENKETMCKSNFSQPSQRTSPLKLVLTFHFTPKTFIKGYRRHSLFCVLSCCFLPSHPKMLSGAKCATIALHVYSVRVRTRKRSSLRFSNQGMNKDMALLLI